MKYIYFIEIFSSLLMVKNNLKSALIKKGKLNLLSRIQEVHTFKVFSKNDFFLTKSVFVNIKTRKEQPVINSIDVHKCKITMYLIGKIGCREVLGTC